MPPSCPWPLQIIMFLLPARAMLVLHWVGRIAVKLDDISPPDQSETMRPQRQRALHPHAFLNNPLWLIDLFVNCPASQRVQVLTESLLLMNQRTLAWAVAVVLQGGEHDGVVLIPFN
jgi:hypothetical protein